MMWVFIAIAAILLLILFLPINLCIFFNGRFCLSVKVLFFRYVIPLDKTKSKSKRKPKESVKTGGESFSSKLSDLLNIFNALKAIVLRSITVKLFKAHIKVCTDDPCDTALLYGGINALCYAIYDILNYNTKVKKVDIDVTADYNEQTTEVLFDVVITTYVFKFLVSLIKTLADGTIKLKDN